MAAKLTQAERADVGLKLMRFLAEGEQPPYGLNRENTIQDAIEELTGQSYFDLRRLLSEADGRGFPIRNNSGGCGCRSCGCGSDCRCSCCCKRVPVLCGCGWGSVAMKVGEIPETCPVCGMVVGAGDGEVADDALEQNPVKSSLLDEKNHLSHGFYMVSEKTARKLAKAARSHVSPREKQKHLRESRDGMLPSAGFELLVEHDGELLWLARTPHKKRMVWSVRKKDAR